MVCGEENDAIFGHARYERDHEFARDGVHACIGVRVTNVGMRNERIGVCEWCGVGETMLLMVLPENNKAEQ